MSTVQQSAPAVCPDAAHMGEHACTNRAQCWEPCGELGHSEEHAQAIHPDDEAVDRFAAVLKDKLTVARAKGRGGWQDKAEVTADELTDMLVGHLWKGDPRDVANFCMFLWERGERITLADNQRMERAALERRGMSDRDMHSLFFDVIKVLEPPSCYMTHCKHFGGSGAPMNCGAERVPGRCSILKEFKQRKAAKEKAKAETEAQQP